MLIQYVKSFTVLIQKPSISTHTKPAANSWMPTVGVLTLFVERIAHCFGAKAQIRDLSKMGVRQELLENLVRSAAKGCIARP